MRDNAGAEPDDADYDRSPEDSTSKGDIVGIIHYLKDFALGSVRCKGANRWEVLPDQGC